MSSDTPQIDDIYLTALAKPEGAPRDAYLDEACGADTELQHRVQRLLNVQPHLGSFLEAPAFGIGACPTIDQPVMERPGDSIGPYTLLQQIGEGGMGMVFMAEQTEPVVRRVALKVIKPGMDTRQVIRRFEAERHALELMDHPHIARVLDAGTTDTGRPYFVMELVHGVPITQYCDEKQLTPRERLELFVPLCQAVQHAHQKGIIHRDIKPSNVLVALYDDLAVPKIIDFGVAKATGQRLTEKTLFTEYGQVVGTPEYMSPEQAQLNHLDIDTRSDVYSLGVLLYELLAGETPFDRQRLRSAAFDEVLRIIRDEEPPCPSTKLSTSESLPTIAANRRVDPKQLSTLVHGELDWIVMKALEKDRTRRYETASKFAEDVEHYLHDESVSACPPSAAYRFGKFARRNKAAIAMTAATALLLLLGIAGTSWLAVRASQAEAHARRDALLEAQARADAGRQRQRAKALLARMQLELGIQALNADDARGLLHLINAWTTSDENPELRAAIGRMWAIAQPGAQGQLVHLIPNVHSAIAFSLDGKMLATAKNHEAQIWDVATSRAVGPPLPLELPIDSVHFSPDGRRLAVVSSRGIAQLWNLSDQRSVGPSLRHKSIAPVSDTFMQSASFSSDGKLLATGVEGGTVRLWNALTGEAHGMPLRIGNSLTCLAFHPRCRVLATGSMEGVLQLWDVAIGEPQGDPIPSPLPEDKFSKICKIAFSPDGNLVATAYSTDTAVIWDFKTGELHSYLSLQETPPRGWLVDLAFSPDGKRLATTSTDWTARLWDVDTGVLIGPSLQHGDRVTSVDFGVDGKLIATGSYDGAVRLWYAESGLAYGPPLYQGGRADRVTFSPAGRLVASAGLSDARVWRVDPEQWSQSYAGSIRSTVLSPDGRYRATITSRNEVTSRNTVQLVDTTTGKEVIEPISGGIFATLAFSPDSRFLATGTYEFTAKIWEAATGRLRQTLQCPERVYAVAFSPDGQKLAAGLRNGTIQLWDHTEAKKLGLPMRQQAQIRRVEFSPTGQILASLSGNRGRPSELWFWDVTTGPDYVGLRAPHLTLAPDEQLDTFNLDGSLRLVDGSGEETKWILPQPPGNLREMQLATWVALGLEQNLQGQVRTISADRWRTFRDEMNARERAAETTDER